jgi:hypothetical protein
MNLLPKALTGCNVPHPAAPDNAAEGDCVAQWWQTARPLPDLAYLG